MHLPTPQGLASPTFSPPPLDRSLTLIEMIDYNGIHNGSHPIFCYEDLRNGIKTILWATAFRAFDTADRIIQKQVNLDATARSKNVVGILATVDSITFFVLVVGIMRAGFVPFPISTRNSPAAVAHLLRSTGCKHLFVSRDPAMQSLASAACHQQLRDDSSGRELTNIFPIPTFDELFAESAGDDPLMPPLATTDHDDPCIILHSSGSKAFPNAITMTHRMVLEHGLLPYYGEIDLCGRVFSAHAVPMFHIMGFITIPWTAMTGLTIATFPPYEPPIISTPDRVLSGAIATGCSLLYCVPTFLESWAHDPSSVEGLKNFSAVLFAGGPLATSIGNILVDEGILITPLYGLTEIGAASVIIPKNIPKEGWDWLRLSAHIDAVFIRMEGEEIFRLVVKESASHTPAILNTLVDGERAFDTGDLVVRHPSNPMLWKVFGRYDDQIIHSTGEKTNPVPIEANILKDSRIASAIMFGRSKFQPGVLVMPAPDCVVDPTSGRALEEYRNAIWDTVTQANELSPRHSRIFKELILVAHPSKPFEFTIKGTPKRQNILNAYALQIEIAYKTIRESSQSDLAPPQMWNLDDITQFIRAIIHRVIDPGLTDLDNIFGMGGDSLSATSIRNSILLALRQSKSIPISCIRSLPPDFVFDFPSITTLSAFIYGTTLIAGTVGNGDYGRESMDDEIFQWPTVAHEGETILKLKSGNGEPPLIILHGAAGTTVAFKSFQEKFRSALWAVQVTPDTPRTSLSDQSTYYFQKIKEQQAHGPYRLSSYSASSILLVALVKIFIENGDEVIQFAMLDHFPTMFLYGVDLEILDPTDPFDRGVFLRASGKGMSEMMRRDGGGKNPRRNQLANEIWDACNGIPTQLSTEVFWQAIQKTLDLVIDFIALNGATAGDVHPNKRQYMDFLLRWMGSVHIPLTVYIASDGVIGSISPDHREEWGDLGVTRCFPGARVIRIDGGHYEFLGDDKLIDSLQEGYLL